MNPQDVLFLRWYEAVCRRHLQTLSFSELRRAVQALSKLYLGGRSRLATGRELDSRGKRAAFALYFGPLHFLAVRAVVRGLGWSSVPLSLILDLGCGTGTAGAAWALELAVKPRLKGIDRHPWAVAEARWNWDWLGLVGEVTVGNLETTPLPAPGQGVVCAYTLNECSREVRDQWLERALRAARKGVHVLVVEPISTRISGWMTDWVKPFEQSGGRHDEWRLPAELPERLALLDRAAGLDHRAELTCRTLSIGPLNPPHR